MAKINILDANTINQIAAGEVIERPASVVKELIENAIDAGSTSITCEIKSGGIEMIRVTDNGCGIEPSEIRKAFMSHATSKIKTAADLIDVVSLGFRGEALASIASVSEVEVLTKLSGEVMGTRYVVNCGEERTLSDAGCPEGTTIIVKNLFANTPVRKKFLKSAITEASYVSELVEKIALSHPEVSLKYINNSKTVVFTNGNGQLKDVIYGIFGRDITSSLAEVNAGFDEEGGILGTGVTITGYIAKPVVTRSNRGMEHYFVNGRYIRNNIVSKAIEEAYSPYMMQHRYPFTVLNIKLDAEKADVNVHPSKQEIRFEQPQEMFNAVFKAVSDTLKSTLLIPSASDDKPDTIKEAKERIIENIEIQKAPEPFESRKRDEISSGLINSLQSGDLNNISPDVDSAKNTLLSRNDNSHNASVIRNDDSNNTLLKSNDDEENIFPKNIDDTESSFLKNESAFSNDNDDLRQYNKPLTYSYSTESYEPSFVMESPAKYDQLVFTPAKESSDLEIRPKTDSEFRKDLNSGYTIVGQVFETYWIVEKNNIMYIIDQHAAHEKILYEKFCALNDNNDIDVQMLSPSQILSFTPTECNCINEHLDDFVKMGFELEYFSGNEFHLSGVPLMLYGLDPKELISELVDSFSDNKYPGRGDAPGQNASMSEALQNRLATCACKAAVKGNTKLSYEEAKKLIEDLLKLDNPFNCPHGRPVIIEMTKQEMEKKFKRII